MESRPDRHAKRAAALLALAIVLEMYRLVAPWPGYAPVVSRAASVAFIALWSVTGAALVLRRWNGTLANLAWVLAVMTPLSLVAHAAITRVGGSLFGFLYVAIAIGFGFTVKHTFDRSERAALPTNDPGGKPPRADNVIPLMPRRNRRPPARATR